MISNVCSIQFKFTYSSFSDVARGANGPPIIGVPKQHEMFKKMDQPFDTYTIKMSGNFSRLKTTCFGSNILEILGGKIRKKDAISLCPVPETLATPLPNNFYSRHITM